MAYNIYLLELVNVFHVFISQSVSYCFYSEIEAYVIEDFSCILKKYTVKCKHIQKNVG